MLWLYQVLEMGWKWNLCCTQTHKIMQSYNHRTACVGRYLKDHPVWTPCHGLFHRIAGRYILLLHEPPTPAQAIQQGHRQLGRELQGICLWKRLVLMLAIVYYCCKKPINSHILPQRFGASPCWRLDITPDKSSAACRAHSLLSVMCLQQGGGMAQNEYLQRGLLHCIHQKTVTCICLIYESSKSSCNS